MRTARPRLRVLLRFEQRPALEVVPVQLDRMSLAPGFTVGRRHFELDMDLLLSANGSRLAHVERGVKSKALALLHLGALSREGSALCIAQS
jgi:hypothetical protein